METLTDQNWLLSVGTFLPLVGVLVMMFIPRSEEATVKLVGIATAGATLAVGIVTLFAFDYGQSEKLQFFVDAEWIPVINSNYTIGLDGISLPLYFLSQYMKINPTLIPEKAVTGEFLVIRNILFAFDSHTLTADAKESLETLKTILKNYPELKVEVAGYTDALGSIIYNRKLADKRAQTVIDYVTASGIPAGRFVKKAFGESNFAAINTNRNGTDNPEGRKYNIRASFGEIEHGTGAVIRLDTETPEELVNPSTSKYSIVLKKSPGKLGAGYFSNLDLSGKLIIRTSEDTAGTTYIIGVFYDKADAEKYLNYVKGKGFTDAYVTETD